MSVNILGGHAKGHALFVPKGDATRPTTVMLRRKFFDSYQNCEDMTFIDVFAGTGAMAFEALSRGADRAVLCELNKSSYQVLIKNIQSIKKMMPDASIESQQIDAKKYLAYLAKTKQHYDEDTHIFIDPPYELKANYLECLKTLFDSEFPGYVWVESDRQKGIKIEEIEEAGYTVKKTFKQGTTFICLVVK
ncbi:RsmD family RNA methyltransferase [Bacteriovorax sp. Seq25_V]|uniref:RsmD family RNA methyltransferase n=1 Tax=Bacteriovorax sp. Seq25_V TaxID=1201288 RepID=UPI00038A21F4|nr:23S rRNA (adenine(2030)-N(6))-methyltransferase RlmJ [Bacteriovorax sp. Seq25_V]EQC46524.1 RNA methyltransferase, RsmD family [Bacteriovorax sp. Seq25_V]